MSKVIIQADSAGTVAARLLEIEAIKLNHRNPFTWSSGWKSPVYCDNRLALSYPSLRTYIRDNLVLAIRKNFNETECIGGVATAGVPQGVLVADVLSLPFLYVRPKPKDHGLGNLIEGKVIAGQKVVLVEDLVSTGGSSLRAAQALREAGLTVIGMVAVFTYGFDVSEKNFEDAGIPLVCLTDFNQVLKKAVEGNIIEEHDLVYVKSWRLDPANWK